MLPDYLARPHIGPRSRAGVNLNSILTMVIGGFWGAPVPNRYTGLEYGILLHNCTGITIQDQRMSGLLRFDHNGFESGYGLQTSASVQIVINDLSVNDARGGIRGDDTHIICNRAAISECIWGIYLQNGRGKDAFIQNAIIRTDLNCIWINDYTAGNRIDIQNNALTTLQDGGRGIDLNRIASKVVAKNNPINFNSQGIFVFSCIGETTIENHDLNYTGPVWVPGTHTTRGITIQSSQNVQVYNNSITGGIAQREGIVGALSNNILYCCNTVNNATIGVLFLGNNANSRLKSTVFGQHIVGLSMNNAIIGRQAFHGNDWTSAITNIDAGFYGDEFGVFSSRFITNLSYLPNGHDKIVVSGSGTPQEWFLFQLDIEPSCSYYCGENPFPPVPPKISPCNYIKAKLTEDDLIIINHSGSLNDIEAGLMWESKLLLYAKLECYPHLMEGHERATAFYTVSADLVSDYSSFREELKAFLSLTDEENYSDFQAQAAGLISDIILLNTSIDLPVQEGQTALVAQRDQLIDSLTAIAQQMSLLIQTDQTEREAKASTLLSQVANLGGTDIYHDNEKMITAIYLETAAIGNYEYSENQIAQLAPISQQCPIAGGKTVLLARSLRHNYAYNEDVYNDSCQSSTPRQGLSDDEQGQSVLIYPNPASNLLQVQLNNQEGYLEIFDLNGVKRQTIILRDNLNTVNIRNLNAGLYLIRVWTENMTTPHFQKITILR